MSRVKITEYRAKRLILGNSYQGISMQGDEKNIFPLKGRFVVKVDQGIKKRFKQGLVAVDEIPKAIPPILTGWKKKGFSRFIAEPYIPHEDSEEQYLSLERVREGVRILHTLEGGIDIEAHPESVDTFIVTSQKDIGNIASSTGIPEVFLQNLIEVFEKNFFAFLEINPLLVRGSEVHLLDAAVLVDSAGIFSVLGAWSEDDIVEGKAHHPAEAAVHELQKTTPASLKLTVLHPDGGLFFLLSGGGGSIVIADEAELQGVGKSIGNYGEYSGGPSREETHLYTREVLTLLLASKAKKKALIIAGGVANFTDVKLTFEGIIDALSENAEALRKQKVKIFVRRGGPNERQGLAHMEKYLKQENLFGSVHGADAVITSAVDEAIAFITT